MGAEVGPSDIWKGKRKVIEELAQDLDPTSREAVMNVYENWKGAESEDELRRLLGSRLAKKFPRGK